jgi:hypothetical protein
MSTFLILANVELRSLLTLPQEVMARPGMVDHILEVAGTHEAVTPPGPSRLELLRTLAWGGIVLVLVFVLDLLGFCGEKGIRFPLMILFNLTALMARHLRSRARARVPDFGICISCRQVYLMEFAH